MGRTTLGVKVDDETCERLKRVAEMNLGLALTLFATSFSTTTGSL